MRTRRDSTSAAERECPQAYRGAVMRIIRYVTGEASHQEYLRPVARQRVDRLLSTYEYLGLVRYDGSVWRRTPKWSVRRAYQIAAGLPR